MKGATETRKIIDLLKHRHQAPEWAHFVELNIGTGMAGGRWIDFFAFNVYPSKGYRTVAYEIKVSRSDFNRELLNPLKREAAEKLAGECYFVVPNGLVAADEVPDGWGLVVVGKGVRTVKKARQRRIGACPITFVASLARRSSDDGPDLPKSIWKYAGEEITEDILIEAANEALREKHSRELYNVRNEVRDEVMIDVQPLCDLKDLIARRLGMVYVNVETLGGWFDENLGSGKIEIDWKMKQDLRNLRAKIGAILDGGE